jgi:hypothetical protein
MKILYMLFYGSADFLLYCALHKTFKISNKLPWLFISFFVFVALIHAFFNSSYLLKFKQFVGLSLFLVALTLFHIVGVWVIERVKKSTFLTQEAIWLNIKLINIVFLNALYVFVFIVQCMAIFTQA